MVGLGNGFGSGIVMTLGADYSPRQARPQFLALWRLQADAGILAGPAILSAVTALAGLATGIWVIAAIAGAGAVVFALLQAPDAIDSAWLRFEATATATSWMRSIQSGDVDGSRADIPYRTSARTTTSSASKTLTRSRSNASPSAWLRTSSPSRAGSVADISTPIIVKYRDDRTDTATALERWLR
mgnify:CR=1 FL=1